MNRFQSWYRIQPAAIRTLLTVNVVAYLVWQVLLIHIDVAAHFVVQHLALNPSMPGILLEPWQLLTYSFLHLQPGFWGLIHILFNMLWLYWIGKEYEEMHGAHRLFAAYVIGSVGGGLLTVLLHNLFPQFGPFGGIVHGASAAVLGVITVVAIRYPYKSIALLLIGTVRLIYVVIGFLVLDVLFLAGSNTSVSAHMGGALFGYLLATGESRGLDLSSWASMFFPSRRSRRTSSRGRGGWLRRLKEGFSPQHEKQAPPARPAAPHPLQQAAQKAEKPAGESEVDRILDKISEHGYEALTEEEKRVLYKASQR